MRNSHGAAFVVFTQEPGGLWVFHGCSRFRDLEQVTRGHAGTHSTSMESLALSLAMLWGLHLPRGSQVHLLSDGDSSVRAALGLTALPRACADQACIFATLSRSLFLLTEARGHCWHVQHVKGHSQHPANELVDAFARSACADDFCNRVEIHSAISSLCQEPDKEWIWLLPDSRWHQSLPTLWLLRSGLAAAQVSRHVPESVSKQLPCCRQQDAPEPSRRYTLRFAASSFNAQTLRHAGALDVLSLTLKRPGLLYWGCTGGSLSHLIGLLYQAPPCNHFGL